MEESMKNAFLRLWEKHFDGAELPIVFYYTDGDEGVELVPESGGHRCLIADLVKVRDGAPLRFGVDSIGCIGGRRYTGFSDTVGEGFEYFLSCGIPGVVEGERYLKSPELVREAMEGWPAFMAPKRFIVFKRWDMIETSDEPEVVIFFAPPDVLAGLYTLANFDEAEGNGVIAPFGSGCSSIVMHPYLERGADRPRCVLGMFDPSARPHVPANALTFAAPMNRFIRMIENMEESFLITSTWEKMKERIPLTTAQ